MKWPKEKSVKSAENHSRFIITPGNVFIIPKIPKTGRTNLKSFSVVFVGIRQGMFS